MKKMAQDATFGNVDEMIGNPLAHNKIVGQLRVEIDCGFNREGR